MKKIAVIGAGIAGTSASYLLSKKYEVSLFESQIRVDDHSHTVNAISRSGGSVPVDTDFIVLNDCNTPILHALFDHWNVDVQWSEMSFGFYDESLPFYYAVNNLLGLFSQTRNMLDPSFFSFLFEIVKFFEKALTAIELGTDNNQSLHRFSEMTLGEFLVENQFSEKIASRYILPMASAIYTASFSEIRQFPLPRILGLFKDHGLLSLKRRPRWQTVVGGSVAYIEKFLESFKGGFYMDRQVISVERKSNSVELSFVSGDIQSFDEVVLACHADQALQILNDPSPAEQNLLSPWKYKENQVVLHTDSSIMPPRRAGWASWNYLVQKDNSREGKGANRERFAIQTYHMNRLQGLTSDEQYFLTLNPKSRINSSMIKQESLSQHPIFSKDALCSQLSFSEIQGVNRTFYCGSYFGNGLYEDGALSGAQVALRHGVSL